MLPKNIDEYVGLSYFFPCTGSYSLFRMPVLTFQTLTLSVISQIKKNPSGKINIWKTIYIAYVAQCISMKNFLIFKILVILKQSFRNNNSTN